MKTNSRYNTKQRERILTYLESRRGDHLTAEEIVDHFRACGETVGKSTVYRYLDLLAAEGRVRRYKLDTGDSACYQLQDGHADCHEHLHLKCSDCGELFHIDAPSLEAVEREVAEAAGFAIDQTKTVLYGRCGQCRQKGDKE